ncbi:MAG TPA: hypothetical protein VMN78_12985 [Longimicrobiales bacterium]|nr:hypothetical protein [Longimicrobiales bacterium]
MRWQKAIIAGAFALAACETNDAAELVDVTAADLAGDYQLLALGGVPPAELDADYCVDSVLAMESNGDFEIHHHFTQRVATGTDQACRTDPFRNVFDVFWRGEFDNTSTLVIMTILQWEVSWAGGSETGAERTELVGEFDPERGLLLVEFPDIWSFDPHGGSGGKISTGGEARGLGAGTLLFGR